jgi:hypothetical protein
MVPVWLLEELSVTVFPEMLLESKVHRKTRPLGSDDGDGDGDGDGDAVFTVRLALGLVMPTRVAVILELPADCPVAKPAPLIVATVGIEEFQVTCVEISCVLFRWQ